jgi:predicted dehydrogenase
VTHSSDRPLRVGPVRVALLGAGLIGREHAALLADHPRALLAAIADPAEPARALAEQLGVPWFEDYEQLLDAVEPDAAIVALPNQLHVDAGLACIERAIPVLVEKPVADTVASARRLVDAGEASSVPILVGHHRRHAPDIRAARAAIDRGDLGRLVAVNALCVVRKHDAYFDVAWRREPGGGPLLINAIHDVDVLRHLCGEVDEVRAFGSRASRGLGVEDTVAVALRFSGGALGTLLLSDSAPSASLWEIAAEQSLTFPVQPADTYQLFGDEASLSLPSLRVWRHADGGDWRDPLVEGRLPVERSSCYVAQLDNLVDVVRGEAEPVVTGREGLRTLATTLAIARAVADERSVDVAELLD